MIRNLSDRAANGRTSLASVPIAIALMAFGFLAAKLDLFLQITARSRSGGRRTTGMAGSAVPLAPPVYNVSTGGAGEVSPASCGPAGAATERPAPDPVGRAVRQRAAHGPKTAPRILACCEGSET